MTPSSCMFVSIKRDYETKERAVYNILGIRVDGRKEILGLWIQDSESKHAWRQIFDELKARGVRGVRSISMDEVTGLEEGAKAIFSEVVFQLCIFHLICNSLKYVPTRDYKDFTAHVKKSMVHRDSNSQIALFSCRRIAYFVGNLRNLLYCLD